MTGDTLTIIRKLVDAGFESDTGRSRGRCAPGREFRPCHSDRHWACGRASGHLHQPLPDLWLQTGAIVTAVVGLLAIVAKLP